MKRTNTAVWIESANRWQINVQKDGVRKTFTCAKPGRTGQREANRKADEWLEKGIGTERKTIESAYLEYLDREKKVTSLSNYKPKESRWRTWIKPEIGDIRIQNIKVRQVQNVLDNAKAAGRSRKTLSNLYADLTGFFKFARYSGYTSFVPDGLKVPEGTPKPQKNILQPNDILVLMQSDKTNLRNKEIVDPFIHAYRFSVLTGVRPGELLGMQWKDVSGDVVFLKRSINIMGETTSGKNDNAERTIYLSDMAKKELDMQRKLSGKEKNVFPASNEQMLYKYWKRYCEYNGIPKISLYELRHTFVSVAQRLPEGDLKAIVGHSQSMDTFGVYGHQVDGQGKRIAESLDSIFNEIKSTQ